MLFSILTVLFCTCIALQCGYFCFFYLRVLHFKSRSVPASPGITTETQSDAAVSVIICAKNEAKALRQNLPSILAQRYTKATGKPNYEVIVVNDASTDDTAQVLHELQACYEHLRIVHIAPGEPRTSPGKKFALGRGVAQSAYELLLMTDADCRPASVDWLAYMTAPLLRGKQIVAGYGGYESGSGLLNAFVRWETLHTFLQYSTYSLAGIPYMAVGRNLSCTREALICAARAPIWTKVASGDDDLLMRTVATGANTEVVCIPPAFTRSKAKSNWRDWLKQKQRHLSTGKYYKRHIQGLLGAYALSHAGMWLTGILLVCAGDLSPVLPLLGLRCLLYWGIWYITAGILQENRLLFLFPVFDFGWMIYNFALIPYIIWKNKRQWT